MASLCRFNLLGVGVGPRAAVRLLCRAASRTTGNVASTNATTTSSSSSPLSPPSPSSPPSPASSHDQARLLFPRPCNGAGAAWFGPAAGVKPLGPPGRFPARRWKSGSNAANSKIVGMGREKERDEKEKDEKASTKGKRRMLPRKDELQRCVFCSTRSLYEIANRILSTIGSCHLKLLHRVRGEWEKKSSVWQALSSFSLISASSLSLSLSRSCHLLSPWPATPSCSVAFDPQLLLSIVITVLTYICYCSLSDLCTLPNHPIQFITTHDLFGFVFRLWGLTSEDERKNIFAAIGLLAISTSVTGCVPMA